MILLTATGVGQVSNPLAVRDLSGSGLLPVQVEISGFSAVTYRILGRVDGSLPWREIRASDTAGFLEAVSYVPFIALDVTSVTGSGTIKLGLAEG